MKAKYPLIGLVCLTVACPIFISGFGSTTRISSICEVSMRGLVLDARTGKPLDGVTVAVLPFVLNPASYPEEEMGAATTANGGAFSLECWLPYAGHTHPIPEALGFREITFEPFHVEFRRDGYHPIRVLFYDPIDAYPCAERAQILELGLFQLIPVEVPQPAGDAVASASP